MKKLFLFTPLILAIAIIAGLLWFNLNSQAASNDKNFSYFVIAKGSSAAQVGNKLQKAGLIKSALTFKLYLQFTGQTGKLQVGEFRLTPSFNLFQTTKTLFSGPIELWVTIPEGLRREEIVQKFSSALEKNDTFISDFLAISKGKEGYLFPETYLFPREATATAIIKKMLATFDSKTKNLTNSSGLTDSQAIILASILERETKTDAERPVVAGILINRLNQGIPLQVDATVQYAVANKNPKCQMLNAKCDFWPTIYIEDLKIQSPYNTYLNTGLPPSPIANPGLSSLKAAFNPQKSDFLYYIHDKTGQIHYARTLTEHNANVAKYLR